MSLKECTFRGVYIAESDIFEFLKTTRPATLKPTVPGTYASIFKYLTSPDCPIVQLHLIIWMMSLGLAIWGTSRCVGNPSFHSLAASATATWDPVHSHEKQIMRRFAIALYVEGLLAHHK